MRKINLSLIKGNKNRWNIKQSIGKKRVCVFDHHIISSSKTLLIYLLSICLVLTSPASATDYFVSTNGNDNSSGNLENPWKSISYATTKAVAGDTIYLQDGIWHENNIVFLNSGNLTHHIKMTSYKDATPVIEGNISSQYTYGNVISIPTNYIDVSNIQIRSMNCSNGIAIIGDYVNISNCNIKEIGYDSKGTAIGIKGSHILISNVTTNDTGWNQIQISLQNNRNTTDVTIIDCNISNSRNHSLIDLFNDLLVDAYYLQNISVINSTLTCLPGQTAIFPHGAAPYIMENITIVGSEFSNGSIGLVSEYFKDSLVSDNIFINNSNYGLGAGSSVRVRNNTIFRNNTVINSKALFSAYPEEIIYFDKNNLSDFTLKYGNFTITDHKKDLWSIQLAYGATSTIRYLDNKVFEVSTSNSASNYDLGSISYLPSNSEVVINTKVDKAATFTVKKYPISVYPTKDRVNLTLNKFNTSLPQGDVLVNFTADTVDGNNVVFTVGDLKPNNCYLVKRNGEKLTATKANCSGYIKFNNSEWPKHTFTVEEISSSSGGNSSPSQISPVSSAGNDQTVTFGSRVHFNGSESTGDNIVSYEWDFDASNGFQSESIGAIVNHTYETAGTYTVTLRVTDANGNKDCDTCKVTVLEKPDDTIKADAFIELSPSSNNIIPGKNFTVNILADPSTPIIGAQLNFVFDSSMASANSVIEGDLFKQKGASTFFNEGDINSSEGTIKHIYGLIIGTSNVSTPGTMATINLTAGNKTGMAEFNLSNVLISDVNSKSVPYTVANASILIDTAPIMNTICCPKSVDEKSNLAFKISAKDADGDRLTLSASGLPEGASFNRTSGAFAWTPTVGQAGVYTITFKVCDGYLTDSENVTVTVNKLNKPPVINFFEPLNGTFFSEGERIGISVNASDAEGQALNYSIKIDGVMYSSDPAYIWETDYSSSGNHTIEVLVSDRIDEIKRQHTIYISECHPRWDVNEDGVVNILDITNVSQKYEITVSKPYPRYDVNQDGEINILDLTLVGHHFGELVT
ncbi:hypothetical protein MSMAP_2461 [Methanosarcina mazei SarPi]|uniref:Probable pectate lyase C n=2 Tax=Methanosarcina mazei TaxID=2209 RepID=A0A0E3LSV8_METMZ|nr:hypothetical protein MSMAP_2461 [Methanosarcina mazei SarPi]